MSRFAWYEVTVRSPIEGEIAFPEYAADPEEAIANFRSRGAESEQAEVVRVALEGIPHGDAHQHHVQALPSLSAHDLAAQLRTSLPGV
jgi:hypothetical protein